MAAPNLFDYFVPRQPGCRVLQEISLGRSSSSFCLAQLGQYQGAAVLTGFGLLRWHMAQRKRLPLTADFGRIFLPVLRIFSAMTASVRIL